MIRPNALTPSTSERVAMPRGNGSTAADPTPPARAASSEVEAKASPTPATGFIWGAGIESSAIPHLDVDQFAWTQHNLVWREDLKLVAEELGLRHMRYAIPWHYLEPEPGQFDWTIADERIDACRELGLELMLDVMHFGTPAWLPQAVGDPEFPEALERFATALVGRYAGVVRTWCPVNEPLVTALFSGDFGFWPPHSRKWRGYMPVLSRMAQGVSRAIRAIRRVQPDAQVLLCDEASHYKTRDESLQTEVDFRNLRRFVLLDLVTGRVDQHHPLHDWLTAYGLSELDLQWFQNHPQTPDILGLDYYPHTDWQLEAVKSGGGASGGGGIRQRRSEAPVGLYGVASDYFNRYGLPMVVTETSIEGKPINREIWLDRLVEDAGRLRAEGVPLVGLMWWPLFDHLDWDGALTHRIGKLHQVGLYKLTRLKDGTYRRDRTPLAQRFADYAARGDEPVGALDDAAVPVPPTDEQLPPLADWIANVGDPTPGARGEVTGVKRNGESTTTGNGGTAATAQRAAAATATPPKTRTATTRATDGYGIVVFSHLRWGFVWQRPQQFLSRFAKKHPILFVEEPQFDLKEGREPRVELHQVMPNVTVACPHCPDSWSKRTDLPSRLREWTREAVDKVNETGAFDRPLLWYYSPMDSAWSLGALAHRGVVYDCMDELSQFTGAPKQLIDNERRLMGYADIVFTGGHNLWTKKRQQHDNAHFFGCGVEVEHFGLARDPATAIPPDIDFMARPIVGWFGVIDERVDYHLVGEMAKLRPDWSFAMLGPVVKVDPNLLPHAPNLFWMGGRDYSVLPNYCAAFDACMMPFALNEATEFINPTKALEYLATGRPVVSTPVKDVVRQYADLMDIAATPEEFVAVIERNLEHPDEERIRRGIEKAESCSWEATVAQMQELIGQAIKRDDRPSSRKVAPLAEVQLSYQYVPTPGS